MKRALCIGINNYPGTDSDLSGCINDCRDWAAVLSHRGFDVRTLVDAQATRDTILSVFKSMVLDSVKGDSLFLQFSGHGTQVPDESSDEEDGMDEAICAHDCHEGGLIYDDELWSLFRSKKAGVQIVFVSDSCHSGTVARAPGAKINLVDEKNQVYAKRRYLPYQLLSIWDRSRNMAKTVPRLFSNDLQMQEEGAWLKVAKGAAKVPWPVLLLSGCQDHEYSYDANFNGKPNGAMTAYALRALKSLPVDVSYNDWFLALRKFLPNKYYPQTPRMIGSYLKQTVMS